MSNRGPGPVPNRWLYCPRKSDTIISERFLAFKTPLSNAFKDQMPMECMFPPEMIFGYCKILKIKLGLWIDLTNTKRFYDSETVKSHGTQYVKMQCRGHGETPSPEQTQAFIEIVDSFVNERPLEIVAVHCTHGFNRTGFLIASYLVERLDFSVEAALSMFAKARPPGIYKQDYIDELYRRYDVEEDIMPAPALPSWCLEYDDSNDNGGAIQKRKHDNFISTAATTSKQARIAQQKQYSSNNENGGASEDFEEDSQLEGGEDAVSNGGSNKKPKKRRREMVVKDAAFMDGVTGVVLFTEQPQLGNLQLKVQQMCGWESSGFPGAQPVSMDLTNIRQLHDKPYRVSWKADGNRYMMLINKRDEIYFFDRNLSCFKVESLSFVNADNLTKHLEDTLLDGEMVLDKIGNKTNPRYLIYDIIRMSNDDIGMKPFYPDRLNCIKQKIMEPRYKAIADGIIDRPSEPFSVLNKQFWDIRTAGSLLGEKFAKSLLHEPDGLIFQPSAVPYTTGVCKDVLKWKPLNMNSVDFRLKIVKESALGCLPERIGKLYVGGCEVAYAQIKITKTLLEYDNKIIECAVNSQGKWEFMRERKDKTMPNSYNTAQAVVESIKCPVTQEILLNFIDKHGFRDDNDRMPPPSTNQQQQQQQRAQHSQQHQQQQHHQQGQHHQKQQHHQQQQHHKQPQHHQQQHHQDSQQQQHSHQQQRPSPPH